MPGNNTLWANVCGLDVGATFLTCGGFPHRAFRGLHSEDVRLIWKLAELLSASFVFASSPTYADVVGAEGGSGRLAWSPVLALLLRVSDWSSIAASAILCHVKGLALGHLLPISFALLPNEYLSQIQLC
ncbi:hypothetical protein TSMEX_011293, partial [Taenia solium]